MQELWTNVKGYENKYIISNTARIVSLNYNNAHKPKELKQKENRFGQMEVSLSKNNIKKDYMVARLVAEHFIPNPMQKPFVMHKSKNKKNNFANNLEWAYSSEEKHNTYNKGSRKNAVPSFTKISYNGKNYKNYKDIAKDLNINARTFSKRLELGWGLYEALEIPVGKGKDNGSKL